ncbi:hypothetical protein CGRA01v4_15127 [Colletotrichum graminicola]|uniref:Uncharacterized protein n=1 Tax=Colletotrichum graminicola (strain M1.001 / M2 / FGSC 10212) TaxID=645133 RepID=E3QYY7_COLGM|nr:uncharacterized protein GLRG_11219 [Colletotrichum graminicola M1.001]EFQ36075.1 hypothetical protein GLRG_11219 [Colletotrichum graminicola M1.001]WDK23834.1 hypothetical protein CGRA01v4_15127 [Colletotrichum graminicola]
MCTTNTAQEVCCVPVSFYANNRNRAVGWCLLVRATILFHLWKLRVLPDDVNDQMFDSHVLPYLRPLCHMGPFSDPSSDLFDTVILPQFRNKVRHTARKWVVDNRVVLPHLLPGSPSSFQRYQWNPEITAIWFGSVDTVQDWLRILGKRNTANVDARFPPPLPTLLPSTPGPLTPTGRRLAESVAIAQGLITPPQTGPRSSVAPTRLDPPSTPSTPIHPLPLRHDKDESASLLWTRRTRDANPHSVSGSGPGSLTRHGSRGSPPMASPSAHLAGAPPFLQQHQARMRPKTDRDRKRTAEATQAGPRQSTQCSPSASPASGLGIRSAMSHRTCSNSTVVEQLGSGSSSVMSSITYNSTFVPMDHYDGGGGGCVTTTYQTAASATTASASNNNITTQAAQAEDGDTGLAGYSDIQLALEWQLQARRHVLEADFLFKRLMLKNP